MTRSDDPLGVLRGSEDSAHGPIDVGASRLAIVAADSATAARGAAASIARAWIHQRGGHVAEAPDAATWPFLHPLPPRLAPPCVYWAPRVEAAFTSRQASGTRLVTTQASYLAQTWLDGIGEADILLLASADRAALRDVPDVLARRGPFARAFILEIADEATAALDPAGPAEATSRSWPEPVRLMVGAFRESRAEDRLRLCVQALSHGRTPALLLATASACVEVNDLEGAARDLDEAIGLAPEWAAAHFERGKLWLRADDMARASESFRRAAGLMPSFASAWANLGATLGELDRPEEALRALETALALDPASDQVANNVGVVCRELGRLAEAEAAFRRVIDLSPSLSVGHYNLGHALFLQGRYRAALGAYVEGQKRDSARNPVQASRLAMCRLATGNARGALADLQQVMPTLPASYRRHLLADTQAIAWALLTHQPDLPEWGLVDRWLAGELERVQPPASR